MTLSKLAKLANVSVSVVSKAFSGRDGVSEEMREHVFSVAREYGCFQQFYHVPYDKPVVAVIIPEIISQYYISYLEELKRSLEENGYTILISISNFDEQMHDTLVRYYIEHTKADALITFGSMPSFPRVCDTAIISFSSAPTEIGCSIGRFLRDGIRTSLLRLKELGHTRIAFVGEPFTTNQQEIFVNECKALELNVSDELIVCSRYRFEKAGADGAKKLWALDDKPTAVLCAYGYITFGLLDTFNEMGVRIPDDISVISMDDSPQIEIHKSGISHIPALIEEICDEAIKILSERVRTEDPNVPRSILLQTDLHEGKTICKPRNK